MIRLQFWSCREAQRIHGRYSATLNRTGWSFHLSTPPLDSRVFPIRSSLLGPGRDILPLLFELAAVMLRGRSMVRIRNNGWVVSSVFVWVMVALVGHAQTNSPPLAGAPELVGSTNSMAEIASTDASRFFEKYREATRLVADGQLQNAAILMDLLSHSLRVSPWLDIALLKHAQLNERTNDRAAEENYSLLRHRLANAPYFQSNAERAQLFGLALRNTVDHGIDRIRLHRLRSAINRYHSRYAEYPESLAKLAILGYTDMENIHNVNNHLFRYLPQDPRMNPFITYRRFELESIDPEPFTVKSPVLVGTSQVSEHPLRYSALVHAPGELEPARVVENQTIQGFFVVAIAHAGAIFSAPNRVIVLVAP